MVHLPPEMDNYVLQKEKMQSVKLLGMKGSVVDMRQWTFS